MEKQEQDDLLSWLKSRIDEWRQYRKTNYDEKWKEYYRIWRGIWDPQDKLRDSERSRLISPATQQAVEATVSEMEEATFGRDVWFDISDDVVDEQKADIQILRVRMKEDLEKEKWKNSIAESMLNGALYGTGIGELLTDEKEEIFPSERPLEGTTLIQRGVQTRKYICVKLQPVAPWNFSIDPAATDVDSALGCAIDELVPRHQVIKGMKEGYYEEADLGDAEITYENTYSGEIKQIPSQGTVKLTKYYGKVPKKYLKNPNAELKEEDEDDLVEAIVVIANDSEVIKKTESPYMMQDRPVVAYQHDRVPGRFWGRGVVEKGYNAQKALDTELRARADALALTTHPMMGVDASRLPRGMKPKVQPGMTVLTNGNPQEILMPFRFGDLNPVSYKESAELERMVTMATGAMDTAAPTMVNPRNNTLGGMSLMMGASIKRHKRTLANFQESFLIPAIQKAGYRFMQFDPERYPVMDFKFIPASTLGLMAREFETQQLIQLLSVTPPESPVWIVILQSIYENSSLQNRELVVAALQTMVQQAQNPQPDPVGLAQVEVQKESNQVNAQKVAQEGQVKVAELEIKRQEALTKAAEVGVKEKELLLKARELDIKEKELELKSLEAQARAAMDEARLYLHDSRA